MSRTAACTRVCAVAADGAPALAELHAAAFEAPWSSQSLQALLASPGVTALAAVSGDEPVGFVLTRVVCDEAEILTLAVRPKARRAGVASALVGAAIASAAAAANLLWLEVAQDNTAALGLYRRFGFEQAGRRPGYYARKGAPVDALVLRRALNRTEA